MIMNEVILINFIILIYIFMKLGLRFIFFFFTTVAFMNTRLMWDSLLKYTRADFLLYKKLLPASIWQLNIPKTKESELDKI